MDLMLLTHGTMNRSNWPIDISKYRHEVLIGVPGKKRRRKLTITNNLEDFERSSVPFRDSLCHVADRL